jgi:hypothetical protein
MANGFSLTRFALTANLGDKNLRSPAMWQEAQKSSKLS